MRSTTLVLLIIVALVITGGSFLFDFFNGSLHLHGWR